MRYNGLGKGEMERKGKEQGEKEGVTEWEKIYERRERGKKA